MLLLLDLLLTCWIGRSSCPPWVPDMGTTSMLLSPGWLLRRIVLMRFFLGLQVLPFRYYRGSSLFRGSVELLWIPFYLSPGEGIPVGAWYNPNLLLASHMVLTVHGLSSCWTFLSRTVKDLSSFLAPLEKAIRLHLLPKLCNHPPNDSEQASLALPIHLGGLGIFHPCESSEDSYRVLLPLWLLPS